MVSRSRHQSAATVPEGEISTFHNGGDSVLPEVGGPSPIVTPPPSRAFVVCGFAVESLIVMFK